MSMTCRCNETPPEIEGQMNLLHRDYGPFHHYSPEGQVDIYTMTFIGVHPVDGHEFGCSVTQTHREPTEGEKDRMRRNGFAMLERYLIDNPDGDPRASYPSEL